MAAKSIESYKKSVTEADLDMKVTNIINMDLERMSYYAKNGN